MSNHKGTTLAYRAGPDELKQVVEGINRKRTSDQIQALFSSPAAFQGAMLAAQALGLVDADGNSLRPLGKDYLLQSDKRTEILLKAMCDYEPYGLLLEAIFVRDTPAETTTEWIIHWWSANDYGVSQNNREEGATTLGKFIESVGLGTFMIGRRGRPSRIQWATDAGKHFKQTLDSTADDSADPAIDEKEAGSQPPEYGVQPPARSESFPFPVAGTTTGSRTTTHSLEYASLSVPLSGNRVAEVKLPAKLTAKDKKRLLQIMELMIEIDDEQDLVADKE